MGWCYSFIKLPFVFFISFYFSLLICDDDSVLTNTFVPNLERAIGLGDIPDKKKTETIHKMLHDAVDTSYIQAREKVLNFIFGLENQMSLEHPFIKIIGDKDYENLFTPLLSQERKVLKRKSKVVSGAASKAEQVTLDV
ncbi:hypothetical protein [Bacillus thuringiensis]|uniref:hypothetical protein n=1 Tax=Bacillus thuringiensis TaxID=1428 RepID=UPI0021E8AEFE|nr:hypothetical protein [Bacillus thuringiensis]